MPGSNSPTYPFVRAAALHRISLAISDFSIFSELWFPVFRRTRAKARGGPVDGLERLSRRRVGARRGVPRYAAKQATFKERHCDEYENQAAN